MCIRDSYEGEYKNDKQHGQGKMTWASGDIYEGEYKNDKQHGQGKMTWADGTIYEGAWENGSQKVAATENDPIKSVVTIDPKKYWEGALNCYRYTDNPIKESQRPYIDQLTLHVEAYKSYKNINDESDIIMYLSLIHI